MIKCPFHGTIIPRDDEGNPINPSQEPKKVVIGKSPQEWEKIADDVYKQLGIPDPRKRKTSSNLEPLVKKSRKTRLLEKINKAERQRDTETYEQVNKGIRDRDRSSSSWQ